MRKKRSAWKCVLPFLVLVIVQVGVGIVQQIEMMLTYGVEEGILRYQESSLPAFYGELLTLGIMGVWYYALWKRREREGRMETSLFGWKSAGGMAVLALGAYALVGVLLLLWQLIMPELLESYGQRMDEVVFVNLDLITVLVMGLLGPVTEELTFRGIAMGYLDEAGMSFWKKNVTQALLFGLAHMNLVQGVYSFLIGLLMGYFVHRYRSLWAGVILHICVNLCGVSLALINTALPEEAGNAGLSFDGTFAAAVVLLLVVGGGLTFWGVRLVRRDLKGKEAAETEEKEEALA